MRDYVSGLTWKTVDILLLRSLAMEKGGKLFWGQGST